MRMLLAVALALAVGCGKQPTVETISNDCGGILLDPQNDSTWKATYAFSYKNITGSPIELKLIGKSCGCTDCKVGKTVLEPGESTELEVVTHTQYVRKHIAEQVRLSTGGERTLELILLGETYPRIIMEPYSLPPVDVLAGQSRTVPVKFLAYDKADDPSEQVTCKAVGDGFSCEKPLLLATDTKDGFRKSVLQCELRFDCPDPYSKRFGNGEFAGRLEVKRGQWTVVREMVWRAKEAILPAPRRLHFQTKQPENAVLSLVSDEPFSIKRVKLDAACLQAAASSTERAKTHDVRLKFTPAKPDGKQAEEFQLMIETDHPRQRVVRVPIFVLWQ